MPKNAPKNDAPLPDEPQWYKDAVIYELHIRAFEDSDGDGIGDFRGIINRLDYVQDLGVTAIWVLPFYPSPLRDDGYDIAEYTQIHPDYGNLRDFRTFVREAHRRGLRVITELVINHTSDQHPWFQRARKAPPGSRWRDFYVWSDTPDKYSDTRIIFKDFETSNWTWDPVAKAYYWHRFYSHQPDLNYDNLEVHEAVFRVLDHWMDYGVDGLRLDAVPYLFEREDTDCENLPETHDFLKKLRKHVDDKYRDRLLLAEANQWPEDARAYFGDGDECHMNFHFPLMPRMFMALRLEDRTPIIDILEQTPELPEPCQWATFLRNHDELTLEMVTDEERDYMYRMYAADPRMRINLGIRRRLCPLLQNNRRSVELLNSLLFSLNGTPVLYYGDEIGMGDNIYLGDRNSVRTPMQWSADRNAGFSKANPQQLFLPVNIDPEYNYEAVNVEAQQNNPSSLLWWMKRLIAIRRRYRAFSRGTLEILQPENRKVLTYIRRYEDEIILVVANLSRFSQFVELDLSEFKGMIPTEIFGHNEFPPVGEQPYFLTLAPHTFYWFDMQAAPQGQAPIDVREDGHAELPALAVRGDWSNVLTAKSKSRLQDLLPNYLMGCRWFGGKGRGVTSVEVTETLPLDAKEQSILALLTVNYRDGEPEFYMLPLSFAPPEQMDEMLSHLPAQGSVCKLKVDGDTGLLYDGVYNPRFWETLIGVIAKDRKLSLDGKTVIPKCSTSLKKFLQTNPRPSMTLSRAEQSNTSAILASQFIVKLFRRVYAGVNPDLEISRFLTGRAKFPNVPHVHGSFEFQFRKRDPLTICVLHEFVPNDGDAWSYSLDQVRHFYSEVLANAPNEEPPRVPSPFESESEPELPDSFTDFLWGYLVFARLLGERTGEMHRALASGVGDPGFAPQPFTPHYRRSLYQSMRNTMKRTFTELRRGLGSLPDSVRPNAKAVLDYERRVDEVFQEVRDEDLIASRIRIHGDYHLGQVLHTGADVMIIDFEGEPARPISERQLPRSALRDVAGMLRSFHYAAYVALREEEERGFPHDDGRIALRHWGDAWVNAASGAFLAGYREAVGDAAFIPQQHALFVKLLRALMLDKAIYEISYELNNRPDWLDVPLQAVLQLTETS